MSTNDKAARRAKFEAAWVVIKEELLEHFKSTGMPQEAAEWYSRVSRIDVVVFFLSGKSDHLRTRHLCCVCVAIVSFTFSFLVQSIIRTISFFDWFRHPVHDRLPSRLLIFCISEFGIQCPRRKAQSRHVRRRHC